MPLCSLAVSFLELDPTAIFVLLSFPPYPAGFWAFSVIFLQLQFLYFSTHPLYVPHHINRGKLSGIEVLRPGMRLAAPAGRCSLADCQLQRWDARNRYRSDKLHRGQAGSFTPESQIIDHKISENRINIWWFYGPNIRIVP